MVDLDNTDQLDVNRLVQAISERQPDPSAKANSLSFTMDLPEMPPAPIELETEREAEVLINPFETGYQKPKTTASPGSKIALLLLGLSLLFLAQVLWVQKDQWLQHPWAQGLVTRVCALFQCQPPLPSQPQAFVILQREVSPHPQNEHTLSVQLAFRNTADLTLAYPSLKLTFFDYTDTETASRLILPADYRQGTTNQIQPGKIVVLDILVENPGDQISEYQFDFL